MLFSVDDARASVNSEGVVVNGGVRRRDGDETRLAGCGKIFWHASVVIHAVLVLSGTILARLTFARISCAVLVHTKGVGWVLRWVMYTSMAGNQLRDTAEHAATNLFGRQVTKDAFDQIEPRTTGRGEVHVHTRVARQPPLNHGVFVRGVIVGDQMQGLALGNLPDQSDEEPQPFLVPMPRQAGGEEGALRDIEGGEERGGAMALVVVGHRATPALLHG